MSDARGRIDELVDPAANAFRDLCDGAQELGRERFLHGLTVALPRLQSAAAQLPDAEPSSDKLPFEANERAREKPPEAVWKFLPDDWTYVQEMLHEKVCRIGKGRLRIEVHQASPCLRILLRDDTCRAPHSRVLDVHAVRRLRARRPRELPAAGHEPEARSAAG